MKIVGLISDTHGNLHTRAYAALADCDFIIHAGDIGSPKVLHELQTLAPVAAVLGNNDFDEYGQSVGRYAKPEIEGVKFLVAHYPRDIRITAFGDSAVAPGESIPNVCVHGHTHIPRLDYGKEVRPATFIINPGSASWPRGGFPRSIGKMLIDDGFIARISIESLDGDALMMVPES